MEELIDEEKKEIALKMLGLGKLENEEIAMTVGLSLEQIEELEKLLAK